MFSVIFVEKTNMNFAEIQQEDIKVEFKKVYNGLERSLLVKKKLVIFWQGREKQPVWLIMASPRQHFLHAKNKLPCQNKPT